MSTINSSTDKQSNKDFPRNKYDRATKEPHQDHRRSRNEVPEDFNLRMKFDCRICGTSARRTIHPSSFLLPCVECKFTSHLRSLSSSRSLVLGKYHCQERNCGTKWIQRLPFRNVVINTPNCSRCHRRTKIGQIRFRQLRISFSHSLLYKCKSCSKCKSVSLYQATQSGRDKLKEASENPGQPSVPSNPLCEACNVPMAFLKQLQNVFTSHLDDQRRAKSFSPRGRDHHYHPRGRPYQRRSVQPKSEGDSPKEHQTSHTDLGEK